jgi:hypothetical protein
MNLNPAASITVAGELRKMVIQAFDSIKFDRKAGPAYVVMFNPASYSRKYEVQYKEEQGDGSTGSNLPFSHIKPQIYQFELIFDGTGIAARATEVSAEIEMFLQVTGRLHGELHRPYFLRICWGDMIVACVLKSADINYTMFKPDGLPLRAKVNATFEEVIDDALRVAGNRKSSPDVIHQRRVKTGDSLPLLCKEIYGNHLLYAGIAGHNGLDNFRKLAEDAMIEFPPLKDLEEVKKE